MKKIILYPISICLAMIFGCTKPANSPSGANPPSPTTATGLTAYGISTTKVKLSWSDNSADEDGYKIERKTTATNFIAVGTVGKNITQYIDSGLVQNTTYTYRVFSFYQAGGLPTYSNEVSINTGSSNLPSLIDTVSNCSQVWMTKNLDVANYSNGDPIPQVIDADQWAKLTTGAWCYYNNDPANGAIYGKLYNWYAVNDPRGLAPSGWHIPSSPEYETLRDCLAGKTVAGGKMKETGFDHWVSPNAGATNSSGFNALPGGFRSFDGSSKSEVFKSLGLNGTWYCSTFFNENNTLFVTSVALYNDRSDISESITGSNVSAFYNNGYSVRCIKGPEVTISVTTAPVSGITTNTAISGGYVATDGGFPIYARGVIWSTSSAPTVNLNTKTRNGTGLGAFTSNITGLSPNTVYYIRAYATNVTGTAYGSQDTITASNYTLPTISTTTVSLTTQTSCLSGGNITNDGENPISSRGVVWNTLPNPTISLLTRTYDGAGSGTFTSNITSLKGNTTYYMRAYATNSAGTAYGSQVVFTTMVDPSVVICNQVWMTKNLDITTYRNGDLIPQVTDSTKWANLTTGAWCYFNNDPAMGAIYGKLYNWYAVNDPRGLAPSGWHIPSVNEWSTLILCVGVGTQVQLTDLVMSKLQSVGTIQAGTGLWNETRNYIATNSSGFTALPGSFKDKGGEPGSFRQIGIGNYACFWTSTIDQRLPQYFSNGMNLQSGTNAISLSYREEGRSVRCIKD